MDMGLSSSDCDRHSNDPDEDVDQSVDLFCHIFNRQLDLQHNDDDSTSQLFLDSEVHVQEDDHHHNHDHDHDHDHDNDDDFTFMLVGEDDEPIYDDKVFEDGKIRPVFPLFDQNLLVHDEYDIEEIDTLPILPPVDKIFIESPRGFPSSTAAEHEHENKNDSVTGPFCAWSKESATATAGELNKKSNSTGFSKFWRLKEKVGRSNSDGRDAFVFLKSSDDKSTATTSTSSKPVTTSSGTFVKVNVAGGHARVVKQTAKPKKTTISVHEAYLKSKEHSEEHRRRSYLPYRPELMGIFTNAHVGFSKNLHPY